MKLIVPQRSFEVTIAGFDFKFNNKFKYLGPDAFVEALLLNPGMDQLIQTIDFVNTKEVKNKVDYTNKRLLITRTGGRGDFHFILRVVKEIKNKFEGVHVTLACGSKYFDSTKMFFSKLVDEFTQIPCTLKEYEDCDYMYTFEGYIETNPLAKKINAFDLMAMKFFIEFEGDYGMELHMYQKYLDQADRIASKWEMDLKSHEPKVIGIQPQASAIMRTYPFQYQAQLIKWFNEIGYQVLFLESKSTINDLMARPEFKKLDILFPYDNETKGSFELSTALAKKCKLIIAPDSAFTYIGDSFGIPTIVFYGPFASSLRAKKLNVYALETMNGCYNCCIHQELPCKYSDDIYSCCLKRIKPEMVFKVAQQILDGAL